MESRVPRRWDLKFAVITLICIFGAALGGYLLWRDFNGAGAAGQGLPMARVEKREARVKRKPKSSYIWSNIEQDENLYRRDSVQTANGSAAALRLNDGSLLEMGENSLVVIDDIDNLSLNFLKGEVVLRKSDGGAAKLQVGKDGKASFENYAIRIEKPESLARYFIFSNDPKKNSTSVEFNWQTSAASQNLGNIVAQVATDRSFKDFSTLDVVANPVTANLGPGKYYFRLVAGNTPLSSTNQFTVARAETARLLWPTKHQKIEVVGETGQVQLRWLAFDLNEMGKHTVELSNDAKFESIVSTTDIVAASGQTVVGGLKTGIYFWRINSQYGDQKLATNGQDFEVVQLAKLAITLTSPEPNAAFAIKPNLRFTWTSEASAMGAVDYLFEVRDESKKIIVSQKTKAQVLEWKRAPHGRYEWQVQAKISDAQTIGESGWAAVTIFEGEPLALVAPENNAKLQSWEESKQVTFVWKSDSGVEDQSLQYQIDVAQDERFTKTVGSAVTSSTKILSGDLKLVPGEYFWRIRTVDAQKRIFKTSPVQKMAFGLYPPLLSPNVLNPAPGTVFNILEQEKDPTISWQPIEGAKGYEVSVYRAGESSESKTAVKRIQIDDGETQISLKDLKPGQYVYTIQAIDRIQRRGLASSERSLTITYGEPLPAPETVSPEVQ